MLVSVGVVFCLSILVKAVGAQQSGTKGVKTAGEPRCRQCDAKRFKKEFIIMDDPMHGRAVEDIIVPFLCIIFCS